QRTLGRTDEDLLRLSAEKPDADPRVYRKLAFLHAERQEFGADVIQVYEETLKHFPELTVIKHLLMKCHLSMGNTRTVFRYAQELLLGSPGNKVVMGLLIETLANSEAYNEELHDLVCEQSRENPNDDRLLHAYALLNYRSNRFDE